MRIVNMYIVCKYDNMVGNKINKCMIVDATHQSSATEVEDNH